MAGLRFTATQKGHPCASLTGPVCRAGHRRGPAYALIGLIAAAAPAIAADDTTRQRFEYDRQQRLSRATLADGATTSLAYDSSNRLNELRFVSAPSTNAPGAEEIVRYRYDQVSRIAAIEGGAGRLTVAYDDGDLPVSISAPGVPTLSYSYDPSGDVASVVWSPAPVTYRRDLFGNLVDVDHRDLKISYEYSGNARQTVRHLPGGITTTYQYSALGELISIRHVAADGQPICTFGYQYDPIGRVTGADEAGRGWSIHKDYSYDAVGRLARYRDSSGDASSYEYDALGNRIAEAGRHGRIAFGYDGAGRLLSAGAATFSYDRAGRRIGRKDAFGETGYTYDPTGQLASVTRAGVSVRYVYDGDGQRLRRDAPDGDTIYLVDRLTAVPQIVAEYDGSSRLIREYTLARTRAVQRDAHGGTTYLLEDRLGSTRCVIDSTGGVLARYDYSPFGEPRLVEGTPQTDFLFAGEHWDAAAKLYYLRARYYDPGTGQFITPDPLGGVLARPQSFNAHAYTENDPVNRLDPLGLQSVWQDDLGESLEREHTARSDLVQRG